MITVCDDAKSYVTRNVSFFKKVNMYNCCVGNPIPVGTISYDVIANKIISTLQPYVFHSKNNHENHFE